MVKPDKKMMVSLLLSLLLLIPVVIAAQLILKYHDTSFPQVTLSGQSYSGLSEQDAQSKLESEIATTYQNGMNFTFKDQTFTATLAQLGMAIDARASIAQVFAYGHRKDTLQSLREQTGLLSKNAELANEITQKDFLIENTKWQEMSRIETPAQDFSYKFSGKDFVAVAAEEGFVINQEKLRQDIEDNLGNLKNDPIALELIEKDPAIKLDTDQKALTQARILISKEVSLKYGSGSWKVAPEDFGAWIGFASQTDPASHTAALVLAPQSDQIKSYLDSLVPQINREPVNAQLEFKDGKVGVFSLSQEGLKVDTEASTAAIGQTIFQDKNYSAANAALSAELVVNKVAPELTTDGIDNMGITSLLSTGESNFHGSTKSRIHNITVGASKFNGVLVGPGDEFSFDTLLGDVGAKEGYLPELVIKQGQTVPEYGGGLCQVSTTAFRAAVSAGLEVTARTNHAYAVKYYDPQGTDATIYPPSPDLKFVNNTPHYLLIQTRISGNNLYFDFYGTSDGRKVETEGPVVYERGSGGAMKTWWKQRVYDKDGKLFLEKTFYSNYKSAALYPRTNPLD